MNAQIRLLTTLTTNDTHCAMCASDLPMGIGDPISAHGRPVRVCDASCAYRLRQVWAPTKAACAVTPVYYNMIWSATWSTVITKAVVVITTLACAVAYL